MVERAETKSPKTFFQIEGVPHIKQKKGPWCGYTSLAMVLQHLGHSQITPDVVFNHIYPDIPPDHDWRHPPLAPSIDTLALVAKELKPEVVSHLFTRKIYKALQQNKGLSPSETLRTFINKGVPPIIRTPGHFMVVTGMNLTDKTYRVNDPVWSRPRWISAKELEENWSRSSSIYTRTDKNLMLVIRPAK